MVIFGGIATVVVIGVTAATKGVIYYQTCVLVCMQVVRVCECVRACVHGYVHLCLHLFVSCHFSSGRIICFFEVRSLEDMFLAHDVGLFKLFIVPHLSLSKFYFGLILMVTPVVDR